MGNVVLVDFIRFDGEVDTGLFLVVNVTADYKAEAQTFTAIKISSNSASFQVALKKCHAPFLQHDSYINCSSVIRLHEDQVKVIVGTVNMHTMRLVRKQFGQFAKQITDQLDTHIERHSKWQNTSLL